MTPRVRNLVGCVVLAGLAVGLAPADDPKGGKSPAPLVVFVTGDEEYRSEESMPMFAKMLREQHGFRTKVCYALADDGTINPSRLDHIDGLEALKDADLMVMYTRFRALPDVELKPILDYVASGKPAIGFRTATHAFLYKDGPNAKYNDGFALDLWGAKWTTHHGHEKGEFLTDVKYAPGDTNSPLLNGVTPFKVPSWLYHVDGGKEKLPPGCDVLLTGTSLNSSHEKAKKLEQYPLTQPVAWTRKIKRGDAEQRVFFTTLGHPHDFKQEALRKLVVNAVYWCLGREKAIPANGAKAELPGEFKLTTAAFGGHRKNQKPQE